MRPSHHHHHPFKKAGRKMKRGFASLASLGSLGARLLKGSLMTRRKEYSLRAKRRDTCLGLDSWTLCSCICIFGKWQFTKQVLARQSVGGLLNT